MFISNFYRCVKNDFNKKYLDLKELIAGTPLLWYDFSMNKPSFWLSRRSLYILTCCFLFLGAVIIRIFAARGDFVMDEIWSLRLVTENARTIADIFFKIKHDNNHFLNSAWMYMLGPQSAWQLYRIPAVIGGSLCVLFAFLIARRQSRVQGFAALIVMGYCFPFVVYSSEARGYGLMMGFVMMSFYAMKALVEEGRSVHFMRYILFFWLATVLGFLAHLIFICAYLGLAAWSLHEFFRRKDMTMKTNCKDLVIVHSVPTLFFIAVYMIFVKGITIGRGPISEIIFVLYQSFATTFGLWGFGSEMRLFCIVFLLLAVCLVFLIRKCYGRVWVFFAVSIFCAPTLVLIFFPFPFVGMRHFLPSLLLLVFALSYFVDFLWKKSPVSKIAAIGFIFIFLVGQMTYFPRFLEYGRAQFTNTMEYLRAVSCGRPMTVSSDFDFRNELVFNFYKERLKGSDHLRYVSLAAVKTEKDLPDIMLVHYFDCLPGDSGCLPKDLKVSSAVVIPLNGKSYRFSYLRSFPWYGVLSGWSWIVFKKDATAVPIPLKP